MAIVKQTLHPEGDTGTDIYPKTSTDQIVDLPLSSQKQLYAHYIQFFSQNAQYGDMQGTIFYINSINAPCTSIEMLEQQVSSRIVLTGGVNISSQIESIQPGFYIFARSNVSPTDNNINVGIFNETGYHDTSFNAIIGTGSLNMYDTVIALGSNAG